MESKFNKGDVVVSIDGLNISPRRSKVLIIRSVFTYADTKEDAKQQIGAVKVDDSTPVYFCSDCRGNTYFIPERYEDEVDQSSPTQAVETLKLATPSDELHMIMLDEIRSIKYTVNKMNQGRRYNRYDRGRRYHFISDNDIQDDDDDIDGGSGVPVKPPRNPSGGFLSSLFHR